MKEGLFWAAQVAFPVATFLALRQVAPIFFGAYFTMWQSIGAAVVMLIVIMLIRIRVIGEDS